MKEEIFGIIYRAVFPNGKCYVGQTTKSLRTRINSHISKINKENVAFHNAIKKYGEQSLVWEIIDLGTSIEDLNNKEVYWIDFYKAYIHEKDPNGYNMTLGGQSTIGWKPSQETRLNIGKSNKGKNKGEKNSQYGKKGELSTWYGRKHTREEKEKIGKANKGKIISQETREKISKANKGKRKGIPNTEEQKRKISASKMGHVVSEETKNKIRETRRRNKEWKLNNMLKR